MSVFLPLSVNVHVSQPILPSSVCNLIYFLSASYVHLALNTSAHLSIYSTYILFKAKCSLKHICTFPYWSIQCIISLTKRKYAYVWKCCNWGIYLIERACKETVSFFLLSQTSSLPPPPPTTTKSGFKVSSLRRFPRFSPHFGVQCVYIYLSSLSSLPPAYKKPARQCLAYLFPPSSPILSHC